MKTLPPALLLDLDDTILSLSKTALPAWEALCHRFGPQLGAADPADLFRCIRLASDEFWRNPDHQRSKDLEQARRKIVAHGFRLAGLRDVQTAHEMADTFSRERLATIEPFPGAIETLERLRANGRRLALVTNGKSKTQREKIERFSLATHFDCIVVEEEFGVGKPNPRVFRHALAALDATPVEAWMIGDNLAFDIAGSQQLGIHAVWIDGRGQGIDPGSEIRPDRILSTLSEILETDDA